MGNAQNIDDLKKGVVKIMTQVDGKNRVGTGFVVLLTEQRAYIVTASHVITRDHHPHVTFFPQPTVVLTAQVLGAETNEETGLAMLMVEGDIPLGTRALELDRNSKVGGGEPITVIGFPRFLNTPWAVTKGTVTGLSENVITIQMPVEEGNSGGPVLMNQTVVGLVVQNLMQFGRAVPTKTIQDVMNSWVPELREREMIGRDGAPMVLIPAGEFLMGSPDGGGEENEHPQHRVHLDAYYMDGFEVPVSRYADFLQLTGRQAPRHWDQVKTGKHSNLPVILVDWHDAEAYCRWAGKRLPTEAEWEKAARGTNGRMYPWGNEPPTHRLVNFDKIPTPPTVMNIYDNVLAPVGSYEAGKSPYGLHHMAGNVAEWTADWYDKHFYATSPQWNPTGPSNGTERVLRGGAWSDGQSGMESASRSAFTPTTRYFGIGFRCAQDVPK